MMSPAQVDLFYFYQQYKGFNFGTVGGRGDAAFIFMCVNLDKPFIWYFHNLFLSITLLLQKEVVVFLFCFGFYSFDFIEF